MNIATSTIFGVTCWIQWIILVFPGTEFLGGSAVTELGAANIERAFLLTGSGVRSTLSFCFAWRINVSVIRQPRVLVLTIMLASTSTKILGVSAQIGLTAASAVGARGPRIASANW